MTQKDLLALLGLPASDPKLISFFAQRNLSLPQTVAIMKPNSSTPLSVKNSVGVNDKEWGFSYYFRSEVLNDDFPLLKEGKNYTPYFTEIVFNGKLYQKRLRKESDSFWNISPGPDSDIESIENHFGKFDRTKKYPNQYFSFNENGHIIISLISAENRLSGYFAAVKETYELYHTTEFDPKWNDQLNLNLMVVKWLNDNGYLISGLQSLSNNADTLLQFVRNILHGHLWKNQLIPNEQLHKFMLGVFNVKYGLTEKFYVLLEKKEHYDLDWEAEKQWLAAIRFNDETYTAFYAALNQSFNDYKILQSEKQLT